MEFFRLIHNKKIMLALLILILFNAGLFIYQQLTLNSYDEYMEMRDYRTKIYDEIEDMPYSEIELFLTEQIEKYYESDFEFYVIYDVIAQIEYIDSYDEYVTDVIKNAENIINFSIFNTDNRTYSKQNVESTVSAYERLTDISLEIGNDNPVEYFLYNNRYMVYISTIMMLILVFQNSRESKPGLSQIIYSSSGGRGRLAAKRLVFIIFSSLIICGTNCAINFIISIFLYGGKINLSRSLQSIEIFKDFTYEISVAGYLLRLYILMTLALVVISVFIWTVASLIKHTVLSLLVLTTVFFMEYSFLGRITLQSNLKLLKCINFFEFLNVYDYTAEYYNLSLFGNAVNIVLFTKTVMIILLIVFILVGIYTFFIRPQTNFFKCSFLGKFIKRIKILIYQFQNIYNMTVAELYKMLIVNKGIIVFAVALFALISSFTIRNIKYTDTEAYVNSFYEEYSGAISNEIYDYIESEHEKATEIYENYYLQLELYEKGEAAISDLGGAEYRLQTADTIEEGLSIIEDEISRINQINEKLNINASLINNRAYNKLFGSAGYETQRYIIIICLLFIVLIFSGGFRYEEKNQIISLLRSTAGGRKRLLNAKERSSFIMVSITTTIIYLIHFIYTSWQYGISGLLSPVQSILILQDFPFKINIATYLIGIWIIRLFIYSVLTEIVLYLSIYIDQRIIVTGFSILIV